MDILITGGCGYIGSHTGIELANNGHNIHIVDNFSNSRESVINNLEFLISSTDFKFSNIDLLNYNSLDKLFRSHNFNCVIHFAGFKSVNESVHSPLMYYQNNITGTLNLLQLMKKYNIKNLVFSSSAAVYGTPISLPINEAANLAPESPYGRSKYMVEEILKDLAVSDDNWNMVILRYFNPVGAHLSGKIGEFPKGEANNIMPVILDVAAGVKKTVKIFGNDYFIKEGTGIRDYIHVVDLARGHVKALDQINKNCGFKIYNLGTGEGHSVLDLIQAVTSVSKREIPYTFEKRRAGDISESFTDPKLAKKELNWVAEYDLNQMCEDAWRWKINSL